MIQGIIFDLDGTLVESSLDFRMIRQQIGCPDDIDLLDYVADLDCQHKQQQANDIILQHENDDAESAKSLPGMHELLNFLQRKKLPTAIVTRNSQFASDTKLSQNSIPITTVLTRECYPPKPAPDALNAIAQQWQIPNKHIMYVGDYLYDIQAANNANMIACFINHGTETSYQHTADLIVSSLDDLLAVLKRYMNKTA
ncbi:HAD family hydrolase [Shewanella gaetbuli]|uniref:HAD family hydrolase n=1 Tax=Shewanella gaetbuli TaxID=220752 RepID=A0A9X2CK35_9GAMM|nr:HAD family hydrolase [Shewanella gaetbuli]MCL1141230.1 HAD family hydrolase [Shewanella gaetbuli]